MTTIALVDGDIIPYKCGFATEQSTYEFDDGYVAATPTEAKSHCAAMGLDYDRDCKIITEAEPLNHALRLAKNLLLRVEKDTSCDFMEIFLSGEKNYRDALAVTKPYKGNRPDRKPMHFEAIKKYLIDKHGARVTQNAIEADDELGIQACELWQTDTPVICTIDKDLDMIPGWHYNWDKGTTQLIDHEQANWNFYRQLLIGDSTDNIPGCPGIGPKKAEKILTGLMLEQDLYEACCNTYESALNHQAHWKEYMGEQANLLWIQRERGVLWKPPIMTRTT